MGLRGLFVLLESEIAYIAGFVDGEGSILKANNGRGRQYVRTQIYNSDFEVLKWIRSKTGYGWLCEKKSRYDERFKVKNTKPVHMLGFSSAQSRHLIRLLLPYLRVKKQKAVEIMEWWEDYHVYREQLPRALKVCSFAR